MTKIQANKLNPGDIVWLNQNNQINPQEPIKAFFLEVRNFDGYTYISYRQFEGNLHIFCIEVSRAFTKYAQAKYNKIQEYIKILNHRISQDCKQIEKNKKEIAKRENDCDQNIEKRIKMEKVAEAYNAKNTKNWKYNNIE